MLDTYEISKASQDVCGGYHAMRPPRRVTVAEGAAQSLVINQPGGYVGMWDASATPYMVEPMNMLASRAHESVAFVGPARTGKALDVDTPIPTPEGWSTMGGLQVGDLVLDERGIPTPVVFATEFQHQRKCYEVEFCDGQRIVADEDHLWGVDRFYRHGERWRYEVRSTKEMLGDWGMPEAGRISRYRIQNTLPLELPDAVLPVDPYVLGLWLGDGDSQRAVVCSHEDDVDAWVQEIRGAGYTCEASPHFGKAHRIRIDPGVRGVRAPANGLLGVLTSSGLRGNKHIPGIYLRASAAQRLALLQGLMDTDGSASKDAACAIFTNTNPRLVEGVMELCRSLGFTARTLTYRTTWAHHGVSREGTARRVTIAVPEGTEVFRLRRKQARLKTNGGRPTQVRYIRDIREVESRPVKCIQVASPKHLYLAGEGMVPTHNTMALLDAWMAHVVVNDPGDFLVTQMTQEKAREYSKTRIDRAIRHSPALQAMKSTSSQHDNTHDKMFKHGMWLRIAWPTVSNLSSSDYRYVALTDYDRMPDDVDGEGAPYTLGLKRTTTFLSRGMCMVESSPGRDVFDPNWTPATPHEGPPATGVVGIYNRSDRRRWYWPCPDCHEFFEAAPGLALFNLPSDDKLLELVREADLSALAAQYSKVVCPHCGTFIPPTAKHGMNSKGQWLRDGESITSEGRRYGTPATSTIAGYWLGGVAAAYQNWRSLVLRHLQGLREYALTGSELTLKTTVNTDQGLPYTSRALVEAAAMGGTVKQDDALERYIVPDWTRYLVASVDVQGGSGARFVVQVHAVGPHFEQAIVDRFELRDSKRPGVGAEFAPIDPASYAEDWSVLTDRVVSATYKTSDPTQELRVLMTAVDSGGEDGVTDKAYAWWRSLRKAGMHGRVMLIKGASTKNAAMVRETMVGGRNRREKGDVPLYQLNTDLLKDAVFAGLRRQTPGPGYLHVPTWVNKAFIDELHHSEVRGKSGKWSQVRKRNEAFDLACYVRAACLRLGADKIKDWDRAPPWAAPLASNREVVTREERIELKEETAAVPAPVQPIQLHPPARRPRRVSVSRYVG